MDIRIRTEPDKMFMVMLPLPVSALAEDCKNNVGGGAKVLQYKIAAIFTILMAGIIGVCLPIYGVKSTSQYFMYIKAFAAGVILATGFVHIRPDALESLTSTCLGGSPWGDFPVTTLIAMASAIFTMLIESFASGYYHRSSRSETVTLPPLSGQGSLLGAQEEDTGLRSKIVTQILELGIVVHSVIIVSLGISSNASSVKSLMAAITFRQMFEGIGLGGCISEAKFKQKKICVMVCFFSLTKRLGIGIGISVAQVYNENSPMTLKVSGFLNAAAAGFLIYMALVDLVAPLFMDHKAHIIKIQLVCSFCLVLGAGLMSLLAIWA